MAKAKPLTRAELLERVAELEEENQELGEKLDAISELSAGDEDEDEDE